MKQGLFWNLINGNWGYVQLILWIFLCLLFTKNLDVQTAWFVIHTNSRHNHGIHAGGHLTNV